MKDKTSIDRTVAMLLGLKERDVSRITEAFLTEARRRIIVDGAVGLDGFGRFRLQCVKFRTHSVRLTKGTFRKGGRGETNSVVVRYKHWVYFSKSETFRRAIRETQGQGART